MSYLGDIDHLKSIDYRCVNTKLIYVDLGGALGNYLILHVIQIINITHGRGVSVLTHYLMTMNNLG